MNPALPIRNRIFIDVIRIVAVAACPSVSAKKIKIGTASTFSSTYFQMGGIICQFDFTQVSFASHA